MSKFSRLGHQLYTGEVSYDFIGRRRRWYLLSAILIAISLLAVLVRGLTWGIEFKGGADFKAPTTVTATSVEDMRAALESSGVPDLEESTISTIGDTQIRVQTRTVAAVILQDGEKVFAEASNNSPSSFREVLSSIQLGQGISCFSRRRPLCLKTWLM